MPKSSIHIQPIKPNSEAHNLRKTNLDYVYPEHTHKNDSLIKESVHETRSRLEMTVKAKTGRAMQKKATPLREAVVNLGQKNTIQDLKQMCSNIEQNFGIKTTQIHIHEDEGHICKKSGNWKQNRHAHIVFNWVDEGTGRSHKLNKQHMAKLQTLVANDLGLERGQSSDKQHLNSVEFKLQKKFEELQFVQQQRKQAKQEYKKTKIKHVAENISHEIARGVSQTFKRLGGVHEAKTLKTALKHEKTALNEKSKDILKLEKKLGESVSLEKYNELRDDLQYKRTRYNKLENQLEQVKVKFKELREIAFEITVNNNQNLSKELKEEFLKAEKSKEFNKNKGLKF